jgi:hypothetical protein
MVKNWSFVNSHPAFSGIFATLRLALVAQASPDGYAGQAGCGLRVTCCELRVARYGLLDAVCMI